ncbi:hypothetical protein LJR129_003560 [Acidovorax sp. LjRoot129]|uniref:hypothetical protein n=1 Tax=Acidovorax sp. LjRoot129 TaxID=3342260 RepID=UPI003ED0DDA7
MLTTEYRRRTPDGKETYWIRLLKVSADEWRIAAIELLDGSEIELPESCPYPTEEHALSVAEGVLGRGGKLLN